MTMADEARDLGVLAFAVVGTAGLRRARNQPRGGRDLRGRGPGLSLEVIPGEEEGRLAYVAVATGLELGEGSVVVFDTGGGSAQFTFGAARGRRAVQRRGRRGPVHRAFRPGRGGPADVVAEALCGDRERSRAPRRTAGPDAVVGDGRRGDQPRSREARAGHLRPRCGPGHAPWTGPRWTSRSSGTAPGRGRAAADRRPAARPGRRHPGRRLHRADHHGQARREQRSP